MGADLQLLRTLRRGFLSAAVGGGVLAVASPAALRCQEVIEAPRARVGGIAPEFALRDLEHRRRLSEDVFGSRATVLVFLDGRDTAATRPALDVLARLRRAYDCEEFAVVVVDISPRWVDPRTLAELYGRLDRAIVLRDPAGELRSIYLLTKPPIAFLLDPRHDVRYAGSVEGLDVRGEEPLIPALLSGARTPCPRPRTSG